MSFKVPFSRHLRTDLGYNMKVNLKEVPFTQIKVLGIELFYISYICQEANVLRIDVCMNSSTENEVVYWHEQNMRWEGWDINSKLFDPKDNTYTTYINEE